MSIVPSTAHRVERHTPRSVRVRIREETDAAVERVALAGPEAIDARLAELDREWDIERRLEVNAALVGLAGVGLGAFVDKRWLLLPAAVSGFLLQHAVQGWCPPLPLLRRLGARTPDEINDERVALKALRGDFSKLGRTTEAVASAEAALSAARKR